MGVINSIEYMLREMTFSIETAPELATQASRGNLDALHRLLLDIIYWIYPRPWNPVVSLANRKPEAGEVLFDIEVAFETFLEAGLPGSGGGCRVNPTQDAVFTLYKNFAEIGTCTLDTSGEPHFDLMLDTTFFIGDVFSLIAPAVQDATLEGLYFSFWGTR